MSVDLRRLHARLVRPNGRYAALEVVDSTGSTNADLVSSARAGAVDRTVLIARAQTAGHGRRSRRWVSPEGTGLYCSVLLRPDPVPPSRVSWLTLIAGIALVELAGDVGVAAALKWPNDLLAVGGDTAGKLAGVLAETVPDEAGTAVVLGIGLNVRPLSEAVPPGAGGLPPASLAGRGARVTAVDELAVMLLERFAEMEADWRDAAGDVESTGLRRRYVRRCGTIGRRVRVDLGETEMVGIAEDVDDDGRLVLLADPAYGGGRRSMSAGDVVHLRTAG